MPQELMKQAANSSPAWLPIIIGATEKFHEKLGEMTPTRWFDQLLGAAATAVIIAIVAWIIGIPAMMSNQAVMVNDVKEIKKEMLEYREVRASDRQDGKLKDAELDARIRVMESQHAMIMEKLAAVNPPTLRHNVWTR